MGRISQVLLTNDPREVFHLGLVTLGYSGNSTDPKELEQAYENLRKLMPNVRVFNSDSPKEPYLTGEVALGMIWNGEAYMAAQENPAIRYIYPSEGVAVWMDSMVIPKGARNVDNAHAFINFVLQPNVAKVISEEIGYSSPNGAARKLMDEAVRGNRTAYPNRADLKNSEFQIDVGEAITLYEQYWEKLKVNR
ncbi:MAG: extracellular solute-binding protein [Gammaproteobacteria bacterium]|nr:extracellular solute-binding protein [Gammaproteobacteria bacterium]